VADYKGPLPQKTPETAPFFDGLNEHKLMIQRCNACGPYFYPSPFCPSCFSWDVEWFEASGKGTLYSFVINNRTPPYIGDKPFIIAIVELEEGPRMMTNLLGVEADPAKVKCDMPVVIDYVKKSDDVTLPMFRLV